MFGLPGGAVMSQSEEIRAMIATMLMVSPAEIGEGSSLTALNTSLGSAKLRLGLKRIGLALPAGAKPATFGGLIAALSGEAAAPVSSSVSTPMIKTAAPSSGTLQVGVDVEDISSLPAAADYWEHEFYRGAFAKSEIAYAVVQAEPRTHFAGFWCAKEALRKCDPAFTDVSPERTAVAHESDSRPYLTLESGFGPERLPHAVSISHTTDVATAVVVTGIAAPEEVIEAIAPILASEIVPEKRKSRGLAKLFGI
jgi:phosphopantetheinyl transferase (holo-ACP synthase)